MKTGIFLIFLGPIFLILQINQVSPLSGGMAVLAILGLPALGAFLIFASGVLQRSPGNNDGIYHRQISSRGIIAWILGLILTSAYIAFYLGNRIMLPGGYSLHQLLSEHFYPFLDPLAYLLRDTPADNWFFYGTMYTAAVCVFGIRMLMKHRHSPYHIIRTISVMFFQLIFAYLIPHILVIFQQPEFYFSYFWPLKPEYFYPATWWSYMNSGPGLALFFLIFAAIMSFLATPVLTYFYGKRWYCSWVCGCAGLAETAGDSFRQLSDKSLSAWKVERWTVHGILLLITIITGLLWVNSITEGAIFGHYSQALSEAYGFYIGALFAGVAGVGFYPLLGNRIWCRFGCPMAAILGIQQKFFSRFRITTNGGQCISCGNCSTYCEMGIDVKWYAQRGQNVVRASCVGCGICSTVCPRGVLNLENGPVSGRVPADKKI